MFCVLGVWVKEEEKFWQRRCSFYTHVKLLAALLVTFGDSLTVFSSYERNESACFMHAPRMLVLIHQKRGMNPPMPGFRM